MESKLTNTNTIEKQRPSIADHPAVQSNTPSGRKHQQTDKHDCRILDETKSPTKPNVVRTRTNVKKKKKENVPVTHNTHENLTNDDTNNFQVFNGVEPLGITNFLAIPASREHCLEKRLDVSDRKEHITKPSAGRLDFFLFPVAFHAEFFPQIPRNPPFE